PLMVILILTVCSTPGPSMSQTNTGISPPATAGATQPTITTTKPTDDRNQAAFTAAIIAAIATSLSAILGLIGIIFQGGRNIAQQQQALDKQLKAQQDTLDKQLKVQQNALVKQLENQQNTLKEQLAAQRELFDRQQDEAREKFRIEKLHSLTEQMATKV